MSEEQKEFLSSSVESRHAAGSSETPVVDSGSSAPPAQKPLSAVPVLAEPEAAVEVANGITVEGEARESTTPLESRPTAKQDSRGGTQMDLVVRQEPSIAVIIQSMVERGITSPEQVSALERMTALYERMQDRDAEQKFAVAFNALAVEIPRIKTTKAVPNNDGTVRYKFTPLEELDAQVRPLALKYGFSYWWSEGELQPDKITKIFTIQHVAGHKRSTSFTVRRSKPPGSNDSQADGSTHAYGRKGTFCDAFGIVTEHSDDDARGESNKPIGKAMGDDLEARLILVGGDKEAFLKFAGAANFESISMDRFDALDEMLKRKEMGAGKRNEKGEYVF